MSNNDTHASEQHETDLVDSVLLSLIPGIGPLVQKSLLEYFGSATKVLNAAPNLLRQVQGVGPQLTRAITSARNTIDAKSEIERCREQGIRILQPDGEMYPEILREIHDPPSILFSRGELLPQDALAIAIVGTRHASQYGKQQAERLAAGLARAGMTIVSGLARGIDAAAHRGALDAQGRTIAVLASGVMNIYPPEHKDLANQISESGALISEAATFAKPKPGSFPRRNRLITGISLGVIVVEAAQRSGALLTAMHAMEQGREIFAVPGRIDSRVSKGCHQLIRDGAKLVETVDDVLEELGPLVDAAPQQDGRIIHRPAELQLNDQERRVLDQVELDTSIEAIVQATGLPVHRVLSTISVLEMRKLVQRISGTRVGRT